MPCDEKINSNMKLINGASDCEVSVDLMTSLQFLVHITEKVRCPDIVMESVSKKIVLIELSISWEENREEMHEWKGYE